MLGVFQRQKRLGEFERDAQAFRPLPTDDREATIEFDYDNVDIVRERWCPEEEAGLLSSMVFHWVGGLLSLGKQKALEHDDLWSTARKDESAAVSEAFHRQLSLTADSVEAPQGKVGRTMWKVHGRLFVVAGLIKLFHDAVMFTGPFILEVLLKHIQTEGSRKIGIVLALALTATSVVETLTVNAYFHILFRICLHLKTELVDMLYQKSMRLSAGKTSEMGVGAIVNLQSNDAAKLWRLPQYLYVAAFLVFGLMGFCLDVCFCDFCRHYLLPLHVSLLSIVHLLSIYIYLDVCLYLPLA